MRPRNQIVALTESQLHVINSANARSTFDDSIQERLHVRRRAADDAQHLGRRRLMLQGLPQFCVALLDLFEQSHVLDRDHGLVSEGLKKFDLFFSKWSNFLAADGDHSDRNTLSQQWRAECGSHSGNWLSRFIVRELCQLCCNVMYVYRLAVDHGSAGWRPATERSPLRLRNRHRPIYGHSLNHISIDPMNQSIARLTQPSRTFCHRIEHRL